MEKNGSPITSYGVIGVIGVIGATVGGIQVGSRLDRCQYGSRRPDGVLRSISGCRVSREDEGRRLTRTRIWRFMAPSSGIVSCSPTRTSLVPETRPHIVPTEAPALPPRDDRTAFRYSRGRTTTPENTRSSLARRDGRRHPAAHRRTLEGRDGRGPVLRGRETLPTGPVPRWHRPHRPGWERRGRGTRSLGPHGREQAPPAEPATSRSRGPAAYGLHRRRDHHGVADSAARGCRGRLARPGFRGRENLPRGPGRR